MSKPNAPQVPSSPEADAAQQREAEFLSLAGDVKAAFANYDGQDETTLELKDKAKQLDAEQLKKALEVLQLKQLSKFEYGSGVVSGTASLGLGVTALVALVAYGVANPERIQKTIDQLNKQRNAKSREVLLKAMDIEYLKTLKTRIGDDEKQRLRNYQEILAQRKDAAKAMAKELKTKVDEQLAPFNSNKSYIPKGLAPNSVDMRKRVLNESNAILKTIDVRIDEARNLDELAFVLGNQGGLTGAMFKYFYLGPDSDETMAWYKKIDDLSFIPTKDDYGRSYADLKKDIARLKKEKASAAAAIPSEDSIPRLKERKILYENIRAGAPVVAIAAGVFAVVAGGAAAIMGASGKGLSVLAEKKNKELHQSLNLTSSSADDKLFRTLQNLAARWLVLTAP